MEKRIKVQITYTAASGLRAGHTELISWDSDNEDAEDTFCRYCTELMDGGFVLRKRNGDIDCVIMPGAVLEVRFAGVV